MRSHHDMGGLPAGTGQFTEEQLAQLVTRDSLIGVALADAPAQAA